MGRDMNYFRNPDFTGARTTVVGDINGIGVDERWHRETELFAEAILRKIPQGSCTVLDYGCGIGRMSKAILTERADCRIVGTDNSDVQIQHATSYIQDPRFTGVLPHLVEGPFQFAFSLYVLQHVKAVHLRQAIQIIHANLAPGSLFVNCCSEHRMAVRTDANRFLDDGFLGAHVASEIELLFEPLGDLFTLNDLQQHTLLRRIVLGETGYEEQGSSEVLGEPHPARVYRRRDIPTPYWRLPMP